MSQFWRSTLIMDTIKVTLPFTEEQLDDYFDTIDQYYFLVNLSESEYGGKALLNYIYNTSMECDIEVNSYNEKLEELLVEYVQTDKLLSIPVLNDIWIDILHNYAVSDQIEDPAYQRFILLFIQNNRKLVEELALVLSCLKIFLINIVVEDNIDGPVKEFELVKNNIISLRNGSNFWPLFLDLDTLNLPYCYYPQFERTVFDGYKISHYFYDEFTPLSLLRMCIEDVDLEA